MESNIYCTSNLDPFQVIENTKFGLYQNFAPCPYCKVRTGEPCRTKSGKDYPRLHVERKYITSPFLRFLAERYTHGGI